jgi:short-subunit dehydrogenase
MKERAKLVLEWDRRWDEGGGPVDVAELARLFGVSRQTKTGPAMRRLVRSSGFRYGAVARTCQRAFDRPDPRDSDRHVRCNFLVESQSPGEFRMANDARPFAIVTGASSGIGFELAKCCAANGFDLLIAADEPAIHDAADQIRGAGVVVKAMEVDLATTKGVDTLYAAANGRPVSALLANAGRGLGRAFLDQNFDDIRRVIDTNVTGTLYLIQLVGREMRARGEGRILITGSIAGFMPGTYQAVYNGTKALLDSFSFALRAELKDTGVTVTCLMPGATETDFFERADMLDTKVGTQKKQAADEVAKIGFEAMMRGDGDVVTGWTNKLRAAISHILPSSVVAEQHRRLAEPGTASQR